jgi:carbon-monoxide dehydrogenase large subunit
MSMKFGVGQPVPRLEDPILVTGRGRYVADEIPAGALRGYVVRSPHAHARFKITDLDKARGMPGVRAVLTAADVADLKPLMCLGAFLLKPSDEKALYVPPYPILAADTVRHVGDAIAFIVAETVDQAKDAAEAVAVDWEPLAAVADLRAAAAPDAPLVWPDRPGNISFTAELGDQAAVNRVFDGAHRVVRFPHINQRLVSNYMEGRGCIGGFDAASGRYKLTVSSQGAHLIRHTMAHSLGVPDPQIHVLTHDVGGGFGTKGGPYREYALCAVAAKKLGRPVAWISDRNEHFLSDSQGRDNYTVAEMAIDNRGHFLAMRVDLLANMGAYLGFVAPYVPYVGAYMLPGVYRIPVFYCRVRGIFSHTVQTDAYRGAGRPEAAYTVERLVDIIAREIGDTPDAVRRRNFIQPSDMPYTTPTGRIYDSGEFAGHLSRAQEAADWKGFDKRLAASQRRGKIRGIGLSTYIEACGQTSPENCVTKLERDGTVTVLIGTQSQGQGHRTTYAQIASEQVHLPLEKINVVQGDTDLIAMGGGTVGSRSMPTGGPVMQMALAKLVTNMKRLAGDELEASIDDLVVVDGSIRVAGTDRGLSFDEIAALGQTKPEFLEGKEENFIPAQPTFPNGTHVCEVEIDPDTGTTAIQRYVVVDDFGVTLNPLLLAGQVHGGIVQGLGQALSEQAVYDDSGQLLTASFMDYALPHADDVSAIEFETRNVRCTTNPLGVKGAGEAGTIGATPAVMNAVVDALHRAYGIVHLEMPATSERVWQAIQAAKPAHRGAGGAKAAKPAKKAKAKKKPKKARRK